MTKFSFDKPLLTLGGEPMKTSDGKDATEATAIIEALSASYEGEVLTGEQKLKQGLLARKVYRSVEREQDFTSPERTMILERVGKYAGGIALLQITESIDGPLEKPEKSEKLKELVAKTATKPKKKK